MTTKTEEALADFMRSFELVFDRDWEFSCSNLTDDMRPCFISTDGTFLRPGVSDEGNNWGNRGSLLARYRRLVMLMTKEGIYPGPGPMDMDEDVTPSN